MLSRSSRRMHASREAERPRLRVDEATPAVLLESVLQEVSSPRPVQHMLFTFGPPRSRAEVLSRLAF